MCARLTRHYLRVVPRNGWELALLASFFALLLAWTTASWMRARRRPDSGGPSARKAKVLAASCLAIELLWGLAAGRELIRTHPLNYEWTPHWPRMHYFDTPKHRAEYDQFCIDWYNAHHGNKTVNAPVVREGAPEAVMDAREAFLESLRDGKDRSHEALTPERGLEADTGSERSAE